MFSAIKTLLQGVDVCINNAGLAHNEPLLSGRTEGWKNMLDVRHTHCQFRLMHSSPDLLNNAKQSMFVCQNLQILHQLMHQGILFHSFSFAEPGLGCGASVFEENHRPPSLQLPPSAPLWGYPCVPHSVSHQSQELCCWGPWKPPKQTSLWARGQSKSDSQVLIKGKSKDPESLHRIGKPLPHPGARLGYGGFLSGSTWCPGFYPWPLCSQAKYATQNCTHMGLSPAAVGVRIWCIVDRVATWVARPWQAELPKLLKLNV